MSARASFPTASVPAPGRMGVDFEERVDFGRLRDYRLARALAEERAPGPHWTRQTWARCSCST